MKFSPSIDEKGHRVMRLQWVTPVHDKEVKLALRWTVVVV